MQMHIFSLNTPGAHTCRLYQNTRLISRQTPCLLRAGQIFDNVSMFSIYMELHIHVVTRVCSSYAGESIFARTSQHKLARFLDEGMRNEFGVLARLAPLLAALEVTV